MQLVIGYPVPWEEHADNVATAFYCRGLAQNVTMVGFLGESGPTPPVSDVELADTSGWLSILHFGPNARESSFSCLYMFMYIWVKDETLMEQRSTRSSG